VLLDEFIDALRRAPPRARRDALRAQARALKARTRPPGATRSPALRKRRGGEPICACPEFLFSHPDFPDVDLVLIVRP
jgi:hypothetical protein